MAEKMTKKDYFMVLRDMVANSDLDDDDTDDLIDFIDAQIDQLDARSDRAKAKAAAKKIEGDALRDAVQAVLTDEYQSIDDILAQIEMEDVTKSKVTARLSALVRNEIAEKGIAKDGTRRLTVYRLI